jgi:hypothetical protein
MEIRGYGVVLVVHGYGYVRGYEGVFRENGEVVHGYEMVGVQRDFVVG